MTLHSLVFALTVIEQITRTLALKNNSRTVISANPSWKVWKKLGIQKSVPTEHTENHKQKL